MFDKKKAHNVVHESMNSCIVNMGLASWFGGDDQVRTVARESALKVEYTHRTMLMRIATAEHPCRVVDAATDSLIGVSDARL